jgi:L-Ala-D/L-Glu epimerase
MPKIKNVLFQTIVRPLKTTFSTFLGHKREMVSVYVTVLLDNGDHGTGEVPTSFAFRQESPKAIIRTLAGARRKLIGVPIDEWAEWTAAFRKRQKGRPMTASGIEVALFRAWLGEHNQSEHSYWGGTCNRLETDITIPYLTDESVAEKWVKGAARKGFTAYKLKMGGDEARDRKFLSLVHAILEDTVAGFCLRLDGNQCYSVDQFLHFVDHLEKESFAVELIEQPLGKDEFCGYQKIRNRTAIPVILDESVSSYQDATRAIENDLCDGINVKVAKTGLNESLSILEISRQAGKKLMVGCMIETMVGLSAAISFAAGTGAFDFIDLDSVHFLYGRNRYSGIDLWGPKISVVR